MWPLDGSMRTSREAARCLPLRGVVAETQARPWLSRLTPAAPASLIAPDQPPGREVEHRHGAAVLHLDRARRGDDELDRRARELALRP